MRFRQANDSDARNIAALHALSWQNTYQGILSRAYLDSEVIHEKRSIWQDRLSPGIERPWVLLAENDSDLCGFSCIYLNHDSQYGALMDNLHVSPACRGMGLGKQLMNRSFQFIHSHDPKSGLFLWVFEQNRDAVNFYRKLGGVIVSEQIQLVPGGTRVNALKIAWPN